MPPVSTSTNPSQTSGSRFEDEVRFVLEQALPERFLSSVPVFPPDTIRARPSEESNGRVELAREVDFLLHLRCPAGDRLLILECKAQDILAANSGPARAEGPWQVRYASGGQGEVRKDVKRQLLKQAETLLQNVEPLEGRNRLKCWGAVIAQRLSAAAQVLEDRTGLLDYTLVPFGGLTAWINLLLEQFEVLRVQQSAVLRRLRQGQPIPELGHPELPNAVAYARRVRAFLDSELCGHFDLRDRHWAINGGAGMGKSVLLGYTLIVVVTDRVLAQLGDGTQHLQRLPERNQQTLPPQEKRRVILAAHSPKQQAMLEEVYRRFEQHYNEVDQYNEYRKVKPRITVWNSITDRDLAETNVLLVDEAHDLSPEAQRRIKSWFEGSSERHLIVAFDRHQRLRLLKSNAAALTGFDFSRHTTRLSRNYRNPFSVHGAAVGLLFRWFPAAGPRVIPTKVDLEFGLGFRLEEISKSKIALHSREDAHPANNWNHLVGMFSTPNAVIEQLTDFSLGAEHVLWARFAEESRDFSYESLSRYTYHNLHGPDAPDLTDKYIKGQEFPIVVVEGFPRAAAWSELESLYPNMDEEERLARMWQARRLIYLVASRATVFLIFVIRDTDPLEFHNEVRGIVAALARPPSASASSNSGKTWSMTVDQGQSAWSLSRYLAVFGAEEPTPTGPAGGSEGVRANPPGATPPTSGSSLAAATAATTPNALQVPERGRSASGITEVSATPAHKPEAAPLRTSPAGPSPDEAKLTQPELRTSPIPEILAAGNGKGKRTEKPTEALVPPAPQVQPAADAGAAGPRRSETVPLTRQGLPTSNEAADGGGADKAEFTKTLAIIVERGDIPKPQSPSEEQVLSSFLKAELAPREAVDQCRPEFLKALLDQAASLRAAFAASRPTRPAATTNNAVGPVAESPSKPKPQPSAQPASPPQAASTATPTRSAPHSLDSETYTRLPELREALGVTETELLDRLRKRGLPVRFLSTVINVSPRTLLNQIDVQAAVIEAILNKMLRIRERGSGTPGLRVPRVGR